MKKQTATVGRWPLAVGLGISAMCAGNVRVAHAGYWTVEPIPGYPSYTSPDEYARLLAEREAAIRQRYPGQWSGVSSSPPPTYPGSYTPKPWPEAPVENSWVQGGTEATASGIGGKASVTYNSNVYAVLRYVPNWTRDVNGNYVPDPADRPTRPFYLKVHVTGYGVAGEGDGSGEVRVPSREHLKFILTPQGAEPGKEVSPLPSDFYDSGASYMVTNRDFYIKVVPDGSLIQTVALVKVDADGHLDGGRTTTTGGDSSSTRWNHGSTRIYFAVNGEMTSYSLSISNPIEPSWKKFVGVLPQEYQKLVNINGVWVWQPDPSKAQLVAKDFFGTNDIWKIICSPVNNVMTVESAAEWHSTRWLGSMRFDANQNGFSSPTFAWTKPIGAIGGSASSPSLYLTIADDGLGNIVNGTDSVRLLSHGRNQLVLLAVVLQVPRSTLLTSVAGLVAESALSLEILERRPENCCFTQI